MVAYDNWQKALLNFGDYGVNETGCFRCPFDLMKQIISSNGGISIL